MKHFLITLAVLAVSCDAALEIKFKFYGSRFNDVKIVKYGDDVASIVGTRFFNPARGSVFITHGYSFYLQARGARPLIEAHIDNEDDINVIYVDWTAYTNKKVNLNIATFEEV